jgi:hypothetical protein
MATEERTEESARVDEGQPSANSPTGSTAGSGIADPGLLVSLSFQRSASFAQFAAALAAAQGEMEGASKDSLNPHFKNKYADLAAVWDACRTPLSKHGIAVIQPPCAQGPTVTVTTLLVHRSGEFIQSDLTMTAQQNTPQGIGSCITYARRYALQSMVGIAPEDDDGNAASSMTNGHAQRGPSIAIPKSAPDGFDEWLIDLEATADNGSEALKAAWTKSQPYFRKHLTDTDNARWERLKAKAAKVKEAVGA